MQRREFLSAFGVASTWPLVAWAQQTKNDRFARVAYLGVGGPSILDPRQIEGFKQGLLENGLIEGSNIEVDYLWAEGDLTRMKELATILGQRRLDVIVTAGSQTSLALMGTKTKTPIVFAVVSDPIRTGLVSSLARPGGNVTGLAMSGTDLETKRVDVLKEAVPTIKRIMVLHDPNIGQAGVTEVQSAARALGIETVIVQTADPNEFDGEFARSKAQGVDALVTMASPFLNFNRKTLIELAARYRFPSIWEGAVYVREGGLLSYGPNFADMYRRSAGYVAKIIKGAKPSDLPVEEPIKFELAVNIKTASALGIMVPPTMLGRADEVIE